MYVAFGSLLLLPACILTACVAVPPSMTVVVRFRRQIKNIAALQFLFAGVMLLLQAIGSQGMGNLVLGGLPGFSILCDGVSSLMFALVSFVGWVICSYSERYLDGQANQHHYYRWVALTIGSVSLMVLSGNLAMLLGCWVLTSLGLHQLLLFFGDREAAKRAAWTKFAISRFGEGALIAALVLLYRTFGTLNLEELFIAVRSASFQVTPMFQVACVLLAVGALAKSAQFPLHTWMPLTMETPTPVSALMHAGIVNAGGYLVIRTSPLVALSPLALYVLAIVGAITACFGAAVMLTQTNVKKSLAYSTVAQMGFMMLQCGMGAFSAAMLHLVAHSLYKAHAFLSSGSLLDERAGEIAVNTDRIVVPWAKLAVAGTIIAAFLLFAFTVAGIDLRGKPGGVLLSGIFLLALLQWMDQVFRSGDSGLATRALSVSAFLCLGYAFAYKITDRFVSSELTVSIDASATWFMTVAVLIGFASLFVLQKLIASSAQPRWMRPLYVHASNGFYIESGLRRVFGPLLTH